MLVNPSRAGGGLLEPPLPYYCPLNQKMYRQCCVFFVWLLVCWSKEGFEQKNLKKIRSWAPKGVVFVNNCSIWAIMKIAFWALVTIYFKIEKTSENKKVPPWWGDGGVSPQILPRTNPRVKSKKLTFVVWIMVFSDAFFSMQICCILHACSMQTTIYGPNMFNLTQGWHQF